jgi:hypothetical protein
MRNAKDLLNFSFSNSALQQSAVKIIPNSLENLLDIRIGKLRELSQKIGANSFELKGEHLIPQVYRKFKHDFKTRKLTFDRKELRTLTYAVSYSENSSTSIFNNQEELEYAFKLLEKEWKDSYLFGLIDCLLKYWETTYELQFSMLSDFIVLKLKKYEGSRNSIIGLKNNLKFFSQRNGDLVLGKELAMKNISILKATNYLSVPESWISYPYFSRVIISFFENHKNDFLDSLDVLNDVLLAHGKGNVEAHKTNKRAISKLIIKADKPQFAESQDRVKKLAFEFIGDPEIKSDWHPFDGATEKECQELEKAREILNEWITRQFINVFFNVCINDVRRKNFWLKHASNISSFKVYGSANTKMILKRDDRISQYLDSRFVMVYSNKNVSAFILYMKNYMLIEFSEDGYAFYGYRVDGNKKPNIYGKLNSVDDLRNGSMPIAVTRTYDSINGHHSEGRLFHKDGNFQDGSTLKWEEVFNWWLKNYNVV